MSYDLNHRIEERIALSKELEECFSELSGRIEELTDKDLIRDTFLLNYRLVDRKGDGKIRSYTVERINENN